MLTESNKTFSKVLNRGLMQAVGGAFLALVLAGCSGSGLGNTQIAAQTYGLTLVKTNGNLQQVVAGRTYPQLLTVQLTGTSSLSQGQIPITFTELTTTGVVFLGTTMVSGSALTQTSSSGVASVQVQAPNVNGASITVRAQVQNSQIYTDFTLSTTPNGVIDHFKVFTDHTSQSGPGYGTETAGTGFSIYVDAMDINNALVSNYEGTLLIDLAYSSQNSWLGNAPTLVTSFSCTFFNGLCTIPGITLTDAIHYTTVTVSADASNSQIPIGVPNYVIPVHIGLPAGLRMVSGGTNGDGTGNPSTTTGIALISGYPAQGGLELQMSTTAIIYSTAIVDAAGNWLSNGTAANGITFTANDPHTLANNSHSNSLTPMSGNFVQGTNGSGAVIGTFTPRSSIISDSLSTGGSISVAGTGLAAYTTPNPIYVDPGLASSIKIQTPNGGTENAGSTFYLQLWAYDSQGNLCQSSQTTGGFTGSVPYNGSPSLTLNDSAASPISVASSLFQISPGYATFVGGQALFSLQATVGRASTAYPPVFTVNLGPSALIYGGGTITGAQSPSVFTIALGSAPTRIELRTNTHPGTPPTTAANNRTDPVLCNYVGGVTSCMLSKAVGTGSSNYYAYFTDNGGNPLHWNGTTWSMNDLYGDPVQETSNSLFVDTWSVVGTLSADWSPNQNTTSPAPAPASSNSTFTPTTAGSDTIQLKYLKANHAQLSADIITSYNFTVTTSALDHFAIITTLDPTLKVPTTNVLTTSPFYICLTAQDSGNNNLSSYGTTTPITITSTNPATPGSAPTIPGTSPPVTTPLFNGTTSVAFSGGVGCTGGLSLPNATINATTSFTVSSSAAPVPTPATINVSAGPAALLLIGNSVGALDSYTGYTSGAANNVSVAALPAGITFTTDHIPTFYTSLYDAENNYIGQTNASWSSTVNNTYMGLTSATGPSTLPKLYNGCAAVQGSGTLTATASGLTAVTGNFYINTGALSKIALTQTSASPIVAGQASTWQITLQDAFQNTFIYNSTKNFTISTSLNLATYGSNWSQTLPNLSNVSFNNGITSFNATLYYAFSTATPKLNLVDTTDNISTSSSALIVQSSTPDHFSIWADVGTIYTNNPASTGGNANGTWYHAQLRDAYENAVSDQPTYANPNISLSFSNSGSLLTQQHFTTASGGITIAGTNCGRQGTPYDAGFSGCTTASGTETTGNSQADIYVTTTGAPGSFYVQASTTSYALSHNCSYSSGGTWCNGGNLIYTTLLVQPGSLAKFTWSNGGTWPTTYTAGATMSAFTLTTTDYYSNILTNTNPSTDKALLTFGLVNAGDTINVISSEPTGLNPAFVNGVATFNGISYPRIHQSGIKMAFTASVGGTAYTGVSSVVLPQPGSNISFNTPTAAQAILVLPNQSYYPGYTSYGGAVTGTPSNTTVDNASYLAKLYIVDNVFNPVSTSGSTSCTLYTNNEPLAQATLTQGAPSNLADSNSIHYSAVNVQHHKINSTTMTPSCASLLNQTSQPYTVSTGNAKYILSYLSDTTAGTTQSFTQGVVSPASPLGAFSVAVGDSLVAHVVSTDQFYNQISDTSHVYLAFSDSNMSGGKNCSLVGGVCPASPISFVQSTTSATSTITPSLMSNPSGYSMVTNYVTVTSGAPTLALIVQANQHITPGSPCTTASVTGNPSQQTAGSSFPVYVYFLDSYCNVSTASWSGSVTLNQLTDPGATPSAPVLNYASTSGTGIATVWVTDKVATTTSGYGAPSSYTFSLSGCTGITCPNSPSYATYVVNTGSAAAVKIAVGGESLVYSAGNFVMSGTIASVTAGNPYAYKVYAVDSQGNPTTSGASIQLSGSTYDQYGTYPNITLVNGYYDGTPNNNLTPYRQNLAAKITSTTPGLLGTSDSYLIYANTAYYVVGLLPGESIVNPGIPTTSARSVAIPSNASFAPVSGGSFPVTLQVTDHYYNPISGTPTISSITMSDAGAMATPATPTITGGTGSFTATAYTKGTQYITIASSLGNNDISNTYAVGAGALHSIKFFTSTGGEMMNGGSGNAKTSIAPSLAIGSNVSQLCAFGYDLAGNDYGDVAVTWSDASVAAPLLTYNPSPFTYAMPFTAAATCTDFFGVRHGNATLTATAVSTAITAPLSRSPASDPAIGVPITAATSDTQSNALLGSNSVVAQYYWDLSADDDHGSWATTATTASWFTEASSTIRSKRQDFPLLAHIVATTTDLNIIDATTNTLFMRFPRGTNKAINSYYGAITSVTAKNGSIYVGMSLGYVVIINFSSDTITSINGDGTTTPGTDTRSNSSIANRNASGSSGWNNAASGMSLSNVNGASSSVNSLSVLKLNGNTIMAVGLSINNLANGAVDVIDLTNLKRISDTSPTTPTTVVALDTNGNVYYGGGYGLNYTNLGLGSNTVSALGGSSGGGSFTRSAYFNNSNESSYFPASPTLQSIAVATGKSSQGGSYNLVLVGTANGLVVINDGSTPSLSIALGTMSSGTNVVNVQQFQQSGSVTAVAVGSSGNVYKITGLPGAPSGAQISASISTVPGAKNIVVFNLTSTPSFDFSIGGLNGLTWLRN